jgi:ligand-binding sensor domain-containing protein
MNRYFETCVLLLWVIILVSCKGRDQTDQRKSSISQTESDLTHSISIITDFDTIITPNAPARITRKIRKDNEGNLLFAAYDDIVRYDGNSFTHIEKQEGIDSWYAFDVLEDKKGNIWIGGMGGLSRFDGDSFVTFTTEDGLPSNDVNTIIQDRAGKMWFGTRENAGVYDGKTFSEITNDEGIPFPNVWSITEDRKSNIWLADSVGLWLYNGDSFTNVSKEIWGIYEDKNGNFWSTDMPRFEPAVLSRIDAESLFSEMINTAEVFKTNGIFLGISEDKEGNIWIGGSDGVWCYNGKNIKFFTGKNKID